MFSRFLFSMVCATLTCGSAVADDFSAILTKVEDGKISFRRREKPKEGEKRVPFSRAVETMPAAKDIKVVKGIPGPKGSSSFEAGDDVRRYPRFDLLTTKVST